MTTPKGDNYCNAHIAGEQCMASLKIRTKTLEDDVKGKLGTKMFFWIMGLLFVVVGGIPLYTLSSVTASNEGLADKIEIVSTQVNLVQSTQTTFLAVQEERDKYVGERHLGYPTLRSENNNTGETP